MSDGYNKPLDRVIQERSQHEPRVGESFEWNGENLRCVVADTGCSGCAFNSDMRITIEHLTERADSCFSFFCEQDARSDGCDVKFIKEKLMTKRSAVNEG